MFIFSCSILHLSGPDHKSTSSEDKKKNSPTMPSVPSNCQGLVGCTPIPTYQYWKSWNPYISPITRGYLWLIIPQESQRRPNEYHGSTRTWTGYTPLALEIGNPPSWASKYLVLQTIAPIPGKAEKSFDQWRVVAVLNSWLYYKFILLGSKNDGWKRNIFYAPLKN